MLAGSELSDVLDDSRLMDELCVQTGIKLEPKKTGSLDGAERIVAAPAGYDVAWFSSDAYLRMIAKNLQIELPILSEPIMRSPVVVGVKRSKAVEFGWSGGARVTWATIAKRASDGDLRFAMTNPATSNSGFSALVGVATAFDTTPADPLLREGDIDNVQLMNFFRGQRETAATSGPLVDAYRAKANQLDGFINYESELIAFNERAERDRLEPLELIYPADGVVYADYPLMLINSAREADYRRVRDWLLETNNQRKIATDKHRRPANISSAESSTTPRAQALPGDLGVVTRLVFAYLDQYRRPTRTVYVLDISQSMDNDQRIVELRNAFDKLVGGDKSVTGQFARFRKNERVSIIPFNSDVLPRLDYDVTDPTENQPELVRLSNDVHKLDPAGQTALYKALIAAYGVVQQEGPYEGYITSIVLMTDGEANVGVDRNGKSVSGNESDARAKLLDGFRAQFEQGNYSRLGVRTYVIKFGEASEEDMRAIATLTTGQFFDATTSSLYDAFREIRGFQ